MDEFTRRRLNDIECSKDITPVEALRMMIDDIERGVIKPDGLLIIYCARPEDANWEAGTYRANITRDQEIVQLELARRRCLRAWMGDD